MERKNAKGPAVNLSTPAPPLAPGFVGPEGPLVRTFAKLSTDFSSLPFFSALLASPVARVFKGRTKATGNCSRLFRRYGRSTPVFLSHSFFVFLRPPLFSSQSSFSSVSLPFSLVFFPPSTISRVDTY